MLVGHFAIGMAAKRIEPKISLGTAILAAMLADFLSCLFMLAGVEHFEIRQGVRGAAHYMNLYDVALSHSLAMDLGWALAFAGAVLAAGRGRRVATLLAIAVSSHWVLDWVSHTPDMPLAPGTAARFGLGLWTSIPATLMVEGGLWVLAVAFYARATRARGWTVTIGFWAVVPLLTLIWYNNIAGPPPRDPSTAPIASLVFFSLVVAWAYWMDRTRTRTLG
jgi:uncharacterized membrane protein